MEEKTTLLSRIVSENILLLFDHDSVNEMAYIEKTDRGYKPKNLGKLEDFI
jgi:hypothetical protein